MGRFRENKPMNPNEEIQKENSRIERLSQKLDKLEELVVDKLVEMLENPDEIDRDLVQACTTASGVLKANKRTLPDKTPVPRVNPIEGLVDDPEELPTNRGR